MNGGKTFHLRHKINAKFAKVTNIESILHMKFSTPKSLTDHENGTLEVTGIFGEFRELGIRELTFYEIKQHKIYVT